MITLPASTVHLLGWAVVIMIVVTAFALLFALMVWDTTRSYKQYMHKYFDMKRDVSSAGMYFSILYSTMTIVYSKYSTDKTIVSFANLVNSKLKSAEGR